jgi:hypothetical protein
MMTLNGFSSGTSPSVTVDGNTLFYAKTIRSTAPSSQSHTLFDNMSGSGVLTIGGTASTNSIRGNTTFTQDATFSGAVSVSGDTTIGVAGGATQVLSLNGRLDFYDTAGPYTNYATIVSNGGEITYDAPNGLSTSHIFRTYNSSGQVTGPIFEIKHDENVSRQIHTFNNNINLNASTYPLATTQTHLGYYVKSSGNSITLAATQVFSTFTTLHNITLEKGVWRIDYNVKTECSVAGAITRESTFISSTSSGTNTPLDNPNAQYMFRVNTFPSAGDVAYDGRSFTYVSTASTTLYLTIARQYTAGTFTFTGFIGATRIG